MTKRRGKGHKDTQLMWARWEPRAVLFRPARCLRCRRRCQVFVFCFSGESFQSLVINELVLSIAELSHKRGGLGSEGTGGGNSGGGNSGALEGAWAMGWGDHVFISARPSARSDFEQAH